MLVYHMYYTNRRPFELDIAYSTPVLLHVAGGAGGRGVQLEGALLQHLGDAPVVRLQLQLELVQLLVQLPQVPSNILLETTHLSTEIIGHPA